MKNTSKNCIVGIVIGFIIVAVAFFFIGRATAGHKSAAAHRGAGQYGMTGGAAGGMGGMRGMAGNSAFGTILSADATSITLSTQGGGSKIILISPTTSIMKSVAGSQTDLTTGDSVIVNGTPNADGSISATTVTIRPAGSMPGGASATGGTQGAPMIPAPAPAQ